MHSLELPDEGGIEQVRSSASPQLGAAHAGGSFESVERLLLEQHKEVLKKFMRQERLLSQMSTATAASTTFESMTNSADVKPWNSYELRAPGPRSKMVARKVEETLGSERDQSDKRLFQSYSAFDLELRAEAEYIHRERSAASPWGSDVEDTPARSKVLVTQSPVRRMVAHPCFDIFFGMVVLLNAIFIGMEVESQLSGYWLSPMTSRVSNYIFAGLFTVELLARLAAYRYDFLWSDDWPWNLLDILIVATSLTEIVSDIVAASSDSNVASVTGFKVFRMIRLTRIVKTVRVVRLVRFVIALRTLVSSIVHTLKALFWALTLLGLIVYVFAVLFAQAAYDHHIDPASTMSIEEDAAREKYFQSLPIAMLSLFMSIAGGVSWEDVIFPLKALGPFWVLVFLFYVSFTYFAVLNVVTGVFCQSAIENAQNDHAAVVAHILDNKELHLKKIRTLFNQLDSDEAGLITYEMLKDNFKKADVSEYFESLGLDVTDAWTFFKLLDLDRGGAVEVEEFLLGCLRLRGQARAMDMAKLMYDQSWLVKSTGRFQLFVEEQLRALKSEVTSLAPVSR